jgi:hypothetical protein
MTPREWEQFVNEMFVGEFINEASDFSIWLRLKDCSYLDFDRLFLKRLFKDWSRSKRRGKHSDIMNKKRRKQFGPGKFHAASSAGVHLNKMYVKGWRGINPANP